VEQVASAVQPSVVEITSTGRSGQAIGSGDILTADGYIVTNDHVVTGFSSYVVTLSNGKTLPAQVVGEDAQDDLAVLKVSATGLKPIVFGDSSKAQVGEFVLALGNPLGLQQSATFGIVSALNRTASEAPNGPAGELTGLVQTSAPINPGNSGGALVDLNGDLIGIPTLGASSGQNGSTATGIGFAIPSNRVQYVATQLMQHGSLSSSGQGFLGIQGQDVTAQLAAANGLGAQSGVLVAGFSNDSAGASPAQQAGLRTGDIIVAVNGQQVSGNDDLAGAILGQQPGAHVSLTIVRGTQQQTISVTLGERPANAQG
jgi:S1-C subfamily serine protease